MRRLLRFHALIALTTLLTACATEQSFDPLADYEQLEHSGIVESPKPVGGRFAPADRDAVDTGRYLVVLLGCGACHTDGAFDGAPDMDKALAGSQTGIAWSNPLESQHPGVVYPPNITPDEKTGIGLWSDAQIANAIRAGIGRHGGRRIVTMPWQGYARLTDDDVGAIVAYLRSIPPVEHEVPAAVPPGRKAGNPYVYFGVYRSRN
jgi:mono/diheme cytochrome c family protein